MQFTYTAKTSTGDIQTGQMTAADVAAVKRALREQKLFPIDIHKKAVESFWRSLFGSRERASLSRRDLLSVTTQLAIMTRSGVDLASAFESLANQCNNASLRGVLSQIHRDITGGKSISDTMQVQAGIFGDAYVASVAAGEAAGKLPEVLNRLSQFLRSEMRVRATIRTLLAYPVLLAGVSSLVVFGLVTFVLPKFVEIFGQFEIALPVITRAVVFASEVLRNHLLMWVPAVLGALVSAVWFKRTDTGRRLWDTAMLNLFLIRDITRSFYVGRTFRLLGLMIESGVPLLEGIRLTWAGKFVDQRRLRAVGGGGNGAHGRANRHPGHGHRING
jgi:general secretion pathway protein F